MYWNKIMLIIGIVLAVVSCYSIFQYTETYLYPKPTSQISFAENRYSLHITSGANWKNDVYGPPYELEITIANNPKIKSIEVEQFSLRWLREKYNVPVKRLYIKRTDKNIYFIYKYANIDLRGASSLEYSLGLDINGEKYNFKIETAIENRTQKVNRLLLPLYQ